MSDVEAQQATRDLAVEQRRCLDRRQTDLARQPLIAREDERFPAPTPLAQYRAESPVERAQLLLFTDSLAIGRVAHDDTGRSLRREKIAYILDRKVQEVSDAGGAGV